MLKQVRSGLKNIVVLFGIALLVLSFALWGVPEMRNFTERAPMRVGKVAFSAQTVQAEYNRAVQRRREESGGKFTDEDARKAGVGEQVVAQLANRSVLQQEAEKLGLLMPAKLVQDYLNANEAFQNPATGKFDPVVLQNILQANNLTAGQFQELITLDLLRDQLVQSVAAGTPAPKPLADALMLRQVEMRRVGYLTITDDMAGTPAEPTPAALKAFYEKEKKSFESPEYRTFSALILRPEDYSGPAPAEALLREAYERDRERLYEKPEKRTLYQATFDSQAEADAAAASLRQGGPFEKIAAAKGLSLSAVTFTEITRKDVLDPAVAEAAFAPGLVAGSVAGPVKGMFGWTVAQIAGVKPPMITPFEEVRGEIAANLNKDVSRKKILAAVEAVEDARDTGAILPDAAKAAGASVKTFGPVDSFSFARDGAIVAELPGEVLGEAFLLAEGEESEARELANGGYFFVQVEGIDPPALIPYADVADEVAQKWRANERKTRIAAAVKRVTDAVAKGDSLAAAAAPFNRAVLERLLARGQADETISAELAEDVFEAPPKSVVSGDAGAGDGQTIVEIREIGFAKSRLGAAEDTAFRQFVAYQLNQEYVDAWLATLREDYGVKTDAERLAVLFNEGQ